MKLRAWARLMLISVLSAISVSCSSSGSGLLFCDGAEPFYPRQGEVYNEEKKKWIITHNTTGEKACGWNF